MPTPKEEVDPCAFCGVPHETFCENCGCYLCPECAIDNEDGAPMCPNC